MCVVWLRPVDRPDDKGNDRRKQNRRDEVGSHNVGKPLNRSAGTLRFADHLYDLCEQSIRADAFGLHHEAARTIDRAAGHFVVGILLDRYRLTTDHRLIN